ncbi:MAG: aminotransferase class I/II-fold pyridoxal phosphate-dependent enzyme [Angelakisella sp.]|jgi:DNA-binding transcriptional MocR family regulator|nr:aminotransferase class I/II-fold pyridoxal phosphate-dependent enzyme [Angelakisella sp.]
MEMLKDCPVGQLETLLQQLREEYQGYQARGLSLDMSRGKPNTQQLDLCQGMLDTVSSSLGAVSESGIDCRNYGLLDGLPEVRRLLADMLQVAEDEIIVGGNSSLNLMYDCMTRALLYGVYGSDKPWCKEPEIKFLCPVPGYDRHFAITQHFGIKMINIDMTPEGPDMDQVEQYITDPAVKGIWCVPKYSNPTGVTYSNRVVRRFAKLCPAARDFRIFWDNAYTIHDLYDEGDRLLDLFALLKDEGKEDMVFIFGSTSKISFAGAGLAAVAASRRNIQFMMRQLSIQTISYDKISQLMHVRFFGDYRRMKEHMKLHAAILRPKFQLVQDIFREELEGLGVAGWTEPRGGYFISFQTLPHCAKRTVALCKNAGVTLTSAGATFPYGIDPEDSNIRIAPSYPTLEELETAARLFCLAVKIASVEYLLTTSI